MLCKKLYLYWKAHAHANAEMPMPRSPNGQKTCRTCTFSNHFREANEQYLCALFQQNFVVIPSNIELPLKYQTQVSTCPSPSNRTLVVFKEHLVACSLTFFAHAPKLNLQPNINIAPECHECQNYIEFILKVIALKAG